MTMAHPGKEILLSCRVCGTFFLQRVRTKPRLYCSVDCRRRMAKWRETHLDRPYHREEPLND